MQCLYGDPNIFSKKEIDHANFMKILIKIIIETRHVYFFYDKIYDWARKKC